MGDKTEISEATQDEEGAEARKSHDADRPASAEEEAAAERGAGVSGSDTDEVAAHEKEMGEIGANVKGEGEVD